MSARPIAAALALLVLASCTKETSRSGLSSDYVLSTTDPNAQNHTDVLLRYEDDWLPGTCVGETRLFDPTRLLVEWSCRYETNAGPTNPAAAVGVLNDDDGDGTFEGTLLMFLVPDIDSSALTTHPRLVTFTATPLPSD